MARFMCKMCGGAFEVKDNGTVGTCDYCGTDQTLPRLNDDRKMNLYDRANHFRRNNEYDKAIELYEQILNDDPTDAETYWSLVLCRYGIEYVEDPSSHKRVPTVHRAQYTSIFDDEDYETALKYADTYQKILYEKEAHAINEIQKGILSISQNEEPFDIFICYKESDGNGGRTKDSVLAQELYNELIEEGFKVFLARVTLEDKLGVAYEPYIFAALNSAKVMVVVGTKKEYFNAVWVKNEWSRYLALIKKGEKKTLIPAYKDMDPYDLPQEFSHLQAQDMSKLGFMQDLVHGINKIAGAGKQKNIVSGGMNNSFYAVDMNIAPTLERAFLFLEDGDFTQANEYLEKVLNQKPKCAEAYVGKLMIDLKAKVKTDLAFVDCSFENNNNYKRVLRFGTEELKNEIEGYLNTVKSRVSKSQNDFSYNEKTESVYPVYQEKQTPQTTYDSYKNTELKKAEEEEKRKLAIKNHEEQLARVTYQYNSIPSKKQIEDSVKKQGGIKALLIFAIVFLFLYWPVSIVLFIVRNSKIKSEVKAEEAKYDSIREEYRRLKNYTPYGTNSIYNLNSKR